MGEERSGANGRAVSQRASGNCVVMASVRSVVINRPERNETAVCQLPFSSYAAVLKGESGLLINPGHSTRGKRNLQPLRQGNRKGKGRRVRLGVSGCHLLESVRGSGIGPWLGTLGPGAPRASGNVPRGCRRESAMLNPSGQSITGGRSESAMLNPMRPNPGPGTGPASFLSKNYWQKPEYIIQYPPLETPAQVVQRHHARIVHRNPSAFAVPALAAPPSLRLWKGHHLGSSRRSDHAVRYCGW